MDLKEVLDWTDEKIFKELKSRGLNVGPINDSTRKVYAKKLVKLMKEAEQNLEVDKETIKVVKKLVKKSKKSKAPAPVEEISSKTTKGLKNVTEAKEAAASVVIKSSQAVVSNLAEKTVQRKTEQDTISADKVDQSTCDNLLLPSSVNESASVSSSNLFLQKETGRVDLQTKWSGATGSPASTIDLIRRSVQRRRPLHTTTHHKKSAEEEPAMKKLKVAEESHPDKFWSFAKISVLFVVLIFLWLVYSVMESNPSTLSLL